MIIKLIDEQKFLLQNEGDIILVTDIEIDPIALQSGTMLMKGYKFGVNYEQDTVYNDGEINIQIDFKIDGTWGKDD